MAPRDELVSSAVTFLRDPSVASSPIEKRIEFLKSKNLTQEEVDLALSQASTGSGAGPASSPAPYFPPPQAYQYNGYPPPYGNQWQPQQPPPELPRRDWRDWFIMATVLGGASYGIYAVAQRYIKPLIAPPTPPQLEQDKAAIDEQFNKAFALLDTLSSDTAALKQAEEARTERLDRAIADVESIAKDLREASIKRHEEAKRLDTEIKSMRDSLPRSLDSVREGSERQLKELGAELASLKTLMANRMGSGSQTPGSAYVPSASSIGSRSTPQQQPDISSSSRVPSSTAEAVAPGSKTNLTGVNSSSTTPSFAAPGATSFPSSSAAPASSTAAKPNCGSSKASIPAWQMAAQSKTPSAPTAVSAAAAQDGADAVAVLDAS